MRPSSSPSEGGRPPDSPFGPLFGTEAVAAELSGGALLQAMLDAEAALARALARVGRIPSRDADAIAAACDAERYDVAAIGRAAVGPGTPVVPLVRALTAAVPGDAAGYVHQGMTSQDVIDTALVLVARRALHPLLADLDAAGDACA
ncbi:MAG: lyase family protein, partial [Streptomycetales bacterium]